MKKLLTLFMVAVSVAAVTVGVTKASNADTVKATGTIVLGGLPPRPEPTSSSSSPSYGLPPRPEPVPSVQNDVKISDCNGDYVDSSINLDADLRNTSESNPANMTFCIKLAKGNKKAYGIRASYLSDHALAANVYVMVQDVTSWPFGRISSPGKLSELNGSNDIPLTPGEVKRIQVSLWKASPSVSGPDLNYTLTIEEK